MSVRRQRISVLNDNPDFLELMSAILDEDAGYEVSVFSGEDTSIDQLSASNPDLIIIDLRWLVLLEQRNLRALPVGKILALRRHVHLD